MGYKYIEINSGGGGVDNLEKLMSGELTSYTIPASVATSNEKTYLKPYLFASGYGSPGITINNNNFTNVVFWEHVFDNYDSSTISNNHFNSNTLTLNYNSTMDTESNTTPPWINDGAFGRILYGVDTININITEDIATHKSGNCIAYRCFGCNYTSNLTGPTQINFNLRPIGPTSNRFTVGALTNMDYLTELNLSGLYTVYSTSSTIATGRSLQYIYSPTMIFKNNTSCFSGISTVKEIFNAELFIGDKDNTFGTVGAGSYRNDYVLTAIILYGDGENVLPLYGSTYLDNCYHILGTYHATYNPDTLHDGYIYVPDDLVDSYKAASTWTNVATQIKGLSEYPATGHYYTQVQALINGTLLN